jgi:hypothetical protein
MSIGIYNRTNVFPTSGSSQSHIGRAAIGKRPLAAVCDNIDLCPDCVGDIPFRYPVLSGDLVYFQFRFADHYNPVVQTPAAGWYTGTPSEDYWLVATLEFGTVADLPLPSSGVITSQSVGYYNGSIQNLVLSASYIDSYAQGLGKKTECFRVKVQTYKYVPQPYLQVLNIGALPDPTGFKDGIYSVSGTDIYITEGGVWVLDHAAVDGEMVFNNASGLFYEFNSDVIAKPWVITTREEERQPAEVCYSYWHRIVECTDTVLFRGVFGAEDCQGHYFGQLGSGLPFLDQYRLMGSFEFNGVVPTTVTNENDIVTELTLKENWHFRNSQGGLPDEIIRRLANTLNATHLFVNSNEYTGAAEINKLNQEGLYWYVDTVVQRLLCERVTDCDDDFAYNPIVNCVEPTCAPTGLPARVHNSNNTFQEIVPCGGELLLADYDYEVFLDGVSVATGSFPAMVDITLNITITG